MGRKVENGGKGVEKRERKKRGLNGGNWNKSEKKNEAKQ